MVMYAIKNTQTKKYTDRLNFRKWTSNLNKAELYYRLSDAKFTKSCYDFWTRRKLKIIKVTVKESK